MDHIRILVWAPSAILNCSNPCLGSQQGWHWLTLVTGVAGLCIITLSTATGFTQEWQHQHMLMHKWPNYLISTYQKKSLIMIQTSLCSELILKLQCNISFSANSLSITFLSTALKKETYYYYIVDLDTQTCDTWNKITIFSNKKCAYYFWSDDNIKESVHEKYFLNIRILFFVLCILPFVLDRT